MVGIVCEMCHSNNGSVFNSSSDRTKFLDYSIQPLCTFLCASCQRFLEPFSCYGFFSTFETFVMSMFAARRFYNAAFLALGIGYLIWREIILSFVHDDIDSTGFDRKKKRNNLRLLFSKGPRGVGSPNGILFLWHAGFEILQTKHSYYPQKTRHGEQACWEASGHFQSSKSG